MARMRQIEEEKEEAEAQVDKLAREKERLREAQTRATEAMANKTIENEEERLVAKQAAAQALRDQMVLEQQQ